MLTEQGVTQLQLKVPSQQGSNHSTTAFRVFVVCFFNQLIYILIKGGGENGPFLSHYTRR
jgi:hypothetical protein